MQFSFALIATLASIISANPLERRDTDPNGSYPVCTTTSTAKRGPFYLKCGPTGGYVQQVEDGQAFCGPDNGLGPTCESDAKPFFYLTCNGLLRDSNGRIFEVANGQLQANYGGGSYFTFGLCQAPSAQMNQLTVNGINTIYICKANPQGTSYRIYTGSQVPASNNANCNAINLIAEFLQ
ncbi:hypothetical protein BCR37DRAFT_394726 [Protomyces lactucae-debilis]|uniref:Uncharacterized protein n=1 Tax=Protomyces lactucae-debilis TaxID=2754530 RepID=A0A1Y2F2X9_PROLT|nr:uncharacterized protein BCR37DRAFT_394726 [Protomyces lactucae-debilis]ORY78229.1 hypothetical protein BCR37DRAFT_394726 [Protomyces lactucae-debilis]